jgi:glutaredoxin
MSEEEFEYIIYTKSGCSFFTKLKEFLRKEGKTFKDNNCDE